MLLSSSSVDRRIPRPAAEEAGLPVMAHIDEPPPSYEEVLAHPMA